MPLPTHLFWTFATGVAVALAARAELRVTPRSALASRSFAAYAAYTGLVLVPSSLYFYLFHGDWFLLYLVDAQRVPSAVALLACLLQLLLGAAGFALGAGLARSQREQLAAAVSLGSLFAALATVGVALPRLSVVGTYAQYHGDFGLKPYGGALLQSSLWMVLWALLGLGFLFYRLGPGARRS